MTKNEFRDMIGDFLSELENDPELKFKLTSITPYSLQHIAINNIFDNLWKKVHKEFYDQKVDELINKVDKLIK